MNNYSNKEKDTALQTDILKLDSNIFDPKLDNLAKSWLGIETQKGYIDFLDKDAIIKEILELIESNKSCCHYLKIEYDWIEYATMSNYILDDPNYFMINYKALIQGDSLMWLECELNKQKHINIILRLVSQQRLTFLGMFQDNDLYTVALLIIITRIDINQSYEVLNNWNWLVKINQTTKLNKLKAKIETDKEQLYIITNKIINILFQE